MDNITNLDLDDWILVALIVAFGAVGYVYCFIHPGAEVFATQTGSLGLIIGAFRWIRYKDQKAPDAS